MGHVGWLVRGKQTRLEDALAIAIKEGTWENYPPAQLRQMARRDRAPFRFSPSQVTRCLRQGVLRRDYDYYLDPESEARMARGSGWHGYLDEKIPGQSEQYLRAELFDGLIVLEGTMDFREPTTKTIYDYKTTGVFRYKTKEGWVEKELMTPEYELQVNAYALLCELNNLPVERAFLMFYADSGARRAVEVPLWSRQEILDVLWDFAQLFHEAQRRDAQGLLPPAIPEGHPDSWQCKYCPVVNICRELNP